MSTILDTILDQKRREVKMLAGQRSSFSRRTGERRGFGRTLDRLPNVAVIAEVKKASPSKGVLRERFDPAAIATAYERGGAAAISVLTDERFFQGSPACLREVRAAVSLPVLRKDFVIDTLQVEQTADLNADAMLLIAAALSDAQMAELFAAAIELLIEPLVEVHNAAELERALRLGPSMVGINSRDLATFRCSLETTIEVAGRVPREVLVVAESGIESGAQTARLRRAGVRAVLVGESLMKLDDPGPLIRELAHGDQS